MFTMTEVSNRAKATPFVPMRVVTSSGESYDVLHPDMMMIGRRELAIGISTPDEPRFFTRLARVSMLHITALEDLPSISPPTQNGKP